MEPIKPPKVIKIYQLVKQTGMNFNYGGSGTTGMGIGFYSTQQEAEHNRTLEVLKDTTTNPKPKWHIWELDVPNPAYTE
jgi:hypothetical protein